MDKKKKLIAKIVVISLIVAMVGTSIFWAVMLWI